MTDPRDETTEALLARVEALVAADIPTTATQLAVELARRLREAEAWTVIALEKMHAACVRVHVAGGLDPAARVWSQFAAKAIEDAQDALDGIQQEATND